MKLEEVKPFLMYNFKSESELIRTIAQIGHNFTKAREDIGDYIENEKMVSAYTCFFLLTNLPKLEQALKKVEVSLEDYLDYEFIDIGAGPGTFSLALLNQNKNLSIKAIEQSQKMISQGKRLVNGLFPEASFEYYSSGSKLPVSNKKRFGIFGHSANEMNIQTIKKFIKDLDLEIILFIEPGTKEFFKLSLEIRQVLQDTYQLDYPCMGVGKCPLPEGDWCHQYLKVQHEFDVERLTQLAQRDRRNLPIILNLFHKTKELTPKEESRIVRVYKPTKFSQEWQVCRFVEGEGKGENLVHDLQILNRGYNKKEIKELNQILAGDKIKFTQEKDLGERKLRGKLI